MPWNVDFYRREVWKPKNISSSEVNHVDIDKACEKVSRKYLRMFPNVYDLQMFFSMQRLTSSL